MKEKMKKTFIQKTIIAIFTIILLINTIMPTVVYADDGDFGGVLFKPIQMVVLALGDATMEIVNSCCGANYSPIIRLTENEILFFTGNNNSFANIVNHSILYLATAPVYATALCIEDIADAVSTDRLPDQLDIPFFAVSPDTIFANRVPMLNINIINPPEDEASIAYNMQSVVASWYNALRNLSIVGLLSVLVYVAIRIIISSTAADKSKYKQMLMDWLIAFCLLFFIHYIMSFAITMTEAITTAVTDDGKGQIILPVTLGECKEKYNLSDYSVLEALTVDTDGDGNKEDDFIRTNLMGYVRFIGQTNTLKEDGQSIMARSGEARMTYTIMYIVLVIYTIMFVFIYMRRLIYIIFLTMISPLVALTYPIDKMNDGKAQAFSTWLKEYIFNLLIQPLHLILYTMLVSAAIQLAVDSLIYPLVVLGFLLQSEKILRKLFGFEKSSTAGSMSGALGGALVMSGINALKNGTKGLGKAASGGKGSTPEIDSSKIKTIDKRKADKGNDTNALFSNAFGNELGSKNSSNVPDFKQKASQQLAEEMKEMDEMARFNQADENYMNDPKAWQENRGKEIEEELKKAYEEEQAQIRMNDIDNQDVDAIDNENIDTIDNNTALLDTNEVAEERPKKNVLNGAKSLLGSFVKNDTSTLGKDIIKGTLKGAGKVAGAATLGTIGVAAGLASDDYTNVLKYGIGAGAVGAGLGGKLGETAWNIPSDNYRKIKEDKEIFQKGAYSKDDYEKIKNEELDKKFMKDKKVKEKYYEAFKKDKEKAKKAMEAALKYRSYGITDDDVIIKAMKAKSKYIKENDFDNQKRIVAAKLAQQVSNEKDVQTARERLEEKGVSKQQAYDQAEMLRQIKDLV